jgi:hypothetical protein
MNTGYEKFLENSLLNNFDYTAVSLYKFCTSLMMAWLISRNM